MTLKVAFLGIQSKEGNELAEKVSAHIQDKNQSLETPIIKHVCIEYDIVN